MDFDEAIGKHSKLKRKLRRYLEQQDSSIIPTRSPSTIIVFWEAGFTAEGARYASLPEFRKLKYEHTRFHVVAADLVRKANSGESVSEQTAPCANSEFSLASSAVVIAILAIKKRLSYESSSEQPARSPVETTTNPNDGYRLQTSYFTLRRRCCGGITPFSGSSRSILSDSLCKGLSAADENCRPAADTVSPWPV